jgi:mannobiose 2-epimerase
LLAAAALGPRAMAQEPRPAPLLPDARAYVEPTRDTYLRLAGETEAALRRDVLEAWFPRCIDTVNGGFHSDFARDWTPAKSGGKFSVFQARMTWIAAQAAMRRPELKARFLPVVRHGLTFLNDVMWDRVHGGFFWNLDDAGTIAPAFGDGKDLYGMSFCLYGAAAAFQATGDPQALDLAQRAFRWMDAHAHDATSGGYFEQLTRDGRIVGPDEPSGKPSGVGFIGFKSMNTHIHLLESFAQLYEVWKDEGLRARVEELLSVVRDRVCVEPGVMNQFFLPNWRPIPDHDSYGHDVETAYLLLEAEDTLGRGHDPRTERMARLLVDHAMAYGWDRTGGGFYRHGTTFGRPEDRQKEWWMQFEGLNALLLMHEQYGWETDAYFRAFQQQWQFITRCQIDAKFHGVFEMVGPDGAPMVPGKGRIWKAAYHDGRALLNVTDRLRRLAAAAAR